MELNFHLRLSFLKIHNSFRIHPYGLKISGDFLPFFTEKEIVRKHIKIGKNYIHHSTQKLTTSKLHVVSRGRWGDLCTDLDSQLSQKLRINELLQWIKTDTQAIQGLLHSSWWYSAPLTGYEASQEENKLKIRYPVVNDPEGLLEKTQILNDVLWKNWVFLLCILLARTADHLVKLKRQINMKIIHPTCKQEKEQTNHHHQNAAGTSLALWLHHLN